MAEFDEKALKAHIKSGDFLALYLFCGDEDYLKRVYVDSIVSKNVSADFESFNLEKFEGKSLELESIFQAAEIMPMMSDKRCIIVEDFKLESMSDGDIQRMREFFSDPPESTILIFHQKKPGFSLSKAKDAVALFKKFGALCVLDKRKGSELINPLISSAKKSGCALTQPMAKYLVSVVGDDFNVLINELGKVCSYAGEGEITKEHIDAVVIKTDDVKIYELTKALFNKDFDEVYGVLNILLRQKITPEYILGVIIGAYVDMYRAKVSVVCGEKGDALAEPFNYKKRAFALSNAARDSSRIDISVIRKCLEELSRADRQLKTGSNMPALVLEQLMVKLFLITNGEKV